jgi:phosphonate transport system permease protein
VDVRPGTLVANIGGFFNYFDRLFTLQSGAGVWTDIPEWFWGWRKWGRLVLDTLLIAYVGTVLGAAAAFALSFLAAANLARSRLLQWSARRYLEFCRSVPELVFALVFVIAFGLGPIPGVLAIAIHTMGALGKLFSEVVENVDMKPVEGAISAGASWPAMVRFAVVPQVLQNFASYALLRFEINVRGASVMGFVGAGGIGQDLIEAIRKFYYSDVSAILLMIIVVVMLIDLCTERLRHALIGRELG